MCSGQNSLGKGGLNAKAGFCYPYNNRYISFLPSDDTEIFISRNIKVKPKCLLKFYMAKYHKDLSGFVLTAGLKLMAFYGL